MSKALKIVGTIAGAVGAIALIGSGIGAALGGTMMLAGVGSAASIAAVAGAVAGAANLGAQALANPARGIIADFANNAAAGLNGALISFTQNTIANMCFGMAPGAPDFIWSAGRNGGSDGTELMRLTYGGNLVMADSNYLNWGNQAQGLRGVNSDGSLRFYNSYGESGRFTSGGNFVIGAPAPANGAGFDRQLHVQGNYPCLTLNGSVGARSYSLGVSGGGDLGIWDNQASAYRLVISTSGHMTPGSDNGQDIGAAAKRLRNIYLGSNPIVTCDVRFKTYRAEPGPSEAELRAALRSFEELGFFQSNDAVLDPEKGPEGARWHFGPRAQGVWARCADEDLCPALVQREPGGDWLPPEGSIPPAFLCFDEWDEETEEVMEEVEVEKTRIVQRYSAILDPVTESPALVDVIVPYTEIELRPTGETRVTREAGNRFGVRIDQLHSLMIAALNAERLKQATTGEEQAIQIAGLTERLDLLEAAA